MTSPTVGPDPQQPVTSVVGPAADELPFGARPGRHLKVPAWVLNADYAITGVMFALLVLVTAWGVVRRYALGDPISWLEEVQLMLFVNIVFLGAGSAFRTASHIGIEFVVDRFHGTVRRTLETLISIIVVVVLIYFAFRGYDLVDMSATGQRTSNILNIPYALVYASLPVGFIWMAVNYVLVTWFGAGERSELDEILAEAAEQEVAE